MPYDLGKLRRKEMSKFKLGELFAGIGGIGLGFEQAGFNVIWANEIDQKACHTYSKNSKAKLFCQDMKTVDPKNLPPIDILTGSRFIRISKLVRAYKIIL